MKVLIKNIVLLSLCLFIGFNVHPIQEKEKQLFDAVENGNLKGVTELLTSKTDPVSPNIYKEIIVTEEDKFKQTATPLHLASKLGRVKIAEKLIENKANINAPTKENKMTPLHWACFFGQVEIVKLLLKQEKIDLEKGKAGVAPIHIAIQTDEIKNEKTRLTIVKLLTDKMKTIDALDEVKRTPLHYAAIKGHLEIIEHLITEGATIDAQNKKKYTPLHYASAKGHLEIVKHLIENKAKIDAQNKKKHTPLHLATIIGHLKITEYLVEKKATIDARDENYRTPLHYAAKNGHLKITEYLVEKKATIDARDENERTPLHYAASNNHQEITKHLFAQGATIDALDKNKLTPLHLVILDPELSRSKKTNIIKIFFDHQYSQFKNGVTIPETFLIAASNSPILQNFINESAKKSHEKNKLGRNALHIAAAKGELETVKSISTEKKINVNAQDNFGNTALHYALSQKEPNKELVQALLDFNAKITPKNKFNKKPFDQASYEIKYHFKKYTRVKEKSSKKRFLNGIVLIDQSASSKRKLSEPLIARINRALEIANSFIFTSGSVLQNFLNLKTKENENYLDDLMKEWKIYRHKQKEAFLFVLVSNTYKKKVEQDWKTCQEAHGIKIQELTEETKDQALGLFVNTKNFLERVNQEALKKFVETEKVKPHTLIKQFNELFVQKSTDKKCFAAWNFYQIGHGSPKSITNLSFDEYESQIKFFNDNINTNFFVLTTCYGGGEQLFLPYQKILKTNFFIVHQGAFDAISIILSNRPDFLRYFELLETFEIDPTATLEKIIATLEYERKLVKDALLAIPFIRYPNSEYFFPANIQPDQVEIITFTKDKKHQLEKKTIEIGGKKQVVFIAPSIVLSPISLQNPTEFPVFFSIFPGSALHFFNELILEKSIDLLKFIEESFFKLAQRLKLAAQKAFIFKSIKFKNNSVEFKNVTVSIYPDMGPSGIIIEGFVSYEQKSKSQEEYKYFQQDWTTEEGYLGAYEETPPTRLQPFITLTEMIEAIVPIDYLKKQKDILMFQEPHKRAVPKPHFPLWAGQQDYRTPVLLIGRLLRKDKWKLDIDPWDFLWSHLDIEPTKITEKQVAQVKKELKKEELKLIDKLIVNNLYDIIKSDSPLDENLIRQQIHLLSNKNWVTEDPRKMPLLMTLLDYNFSHDLTKVSQEKRNKTIEMLIEKGADVNVKDKFDTTPLHLARSADIANLLIKKGAIIEARGDYGKTPLLQAVGSKYPKETVETLIENGANMTVVDKQKLSILHLAVSGAVKEDVLSLIINKLEEKNQLQKIINLQDKDGKTPLDSAIAEEVDEEIINLLKENGAKKGTDIE